jgi:hypothetical protein
MIAHKTANLTTTPVSLSTFLGVSGPFTKIRIGGVSGGQLGDSNLDVSTNAGISIGGNGIELSFDPDDDIANNLFLAASGTVSATVMAW